MMWCRGDLRGGSAAEPDATLAAGGVRRLAPRMRKDVIMREMGPKKRAPPYRGAGIRAARVLCSLTTKREAGMAPTIDPGPVREPRSAADRGHEPTSESGITAYISARRGSQIKTRSVEVRWRLCIDDIRKSWSDHGGVDR
jgi:hypothetical protein